MINFDPHKKQMVKNAMTHQSKVSNYQQLCVDQKQLLKAKLSSQNHTLRTNLV
jgi:hypothetical protein